jgi:hypothetical protein
MVLRKFWVKSPLKRIDLNFGKATKDICAKPLGQTVMGKAIIIKLF